MPDVEVFSQVIATFSESFLELIPGDRDEFFRSHLSSLSILIYQQFDKNNICLSGKLDSINKSKEILQSCLLFNTGDAEAPDSKLDVIESGKDITWDGALNEEISDSTLIKTKHSDEEVTSFSKTDNLIETDNAENKVEKVTVSKHGRRIKLPVKLENYDDLPQGEDEDLDINDFENEVKYTTKVGRKRRVGRPRKVKEQKKSDDSEPNITDDNIEDTKTETLQDADAIETVKENVYLNKKDGATKRKLNLIFEKALIGKRGIKKYYEDRLPFKYFCKICSFKTKRESHFNKHLELHSKNPDLKLHKCEKCDFTAIRVSVLQRHSLTHVSNEGDILKCSECSYSTNNEALLKMHRKRHLKKSAHSCRFCCFSTVYKQKLVKHLESHSESPRTALYQCTKCPYETQNKLNFRRHQRAVHLNQRPHLCDTCGMAFKRTDALQIHKEVHKDRSERKLPFSCKVCQKAFKSMAHVREHMSVHTTVRSFQCHICGQMFKTRQVQQRHLQGVHLKSNWHECTRCKRSFSSKYTLKRHLRQHDEDGNINLQNQMEPKRILNQMTGSVEVSGVGQQQDFVEGQVQDQMDENATAIQTITISSDNLEEFAQHLQPVTGQLQAAGDIGEVYIQGLENVSDTVNIVSIQGEDIGQILTASSESNYTEQLSAQAVDSQNTAIVQDLMADDAKIYQSLTSEQGLQIVSDKQSSEITPGRTDYTIPIETIKLTLDQLNTGTETNTQLINQVNPELEVLNYETVHYVTDQSQAFDGESEGHIVQFITPDGQTYRVKVENSNSI